MLQEEKRLRSLLAVAALFFFQLGVNQERLNPQSFENLIKGTDYGLAIFIVLAYVSFVVCGKAIRLVLSTFLSDDVRQNAGLRKKMMFPGDIIMSALYISYILGIYDQNHYSGFHWFPAGGEIKYWIVQLLIILLVFWTPSLIKKAIDEEVPKKGDVSIELAGKWKKVKQ